jgi:formate hydrogenlyase subunit 3/multisubunit Na+/H+ antiporter MnhD subunit
MSLVLPIALPLLSAFLLPIVARGQPLLGRLLGPAMVAANIGVALWLWQQSVMGGAYIETLGGFAAPLGIVLSGDSLSLLMVLLVCSLILLLWPTGECDPVREPTLTLLLMAGSCGLALSADLFNLFVFYELVAVASYGLVASRGSGPSHIAALRFLILSATGSALALLGIALVYSLTGTLNLAYLANSAALLDGPVGLSAFALMLIGFGVKAELFPVNTWVPEVYAETTSRVSALLSGVISKLALLVLLKLLLSAFGFPAAYLLLAVVGMLTLLSGELAAYHATDLRRVLAYSSIAQLGMIAIAFSVSDQAGVLAGIAVALHHLLAKPALFLLAERWGGSLDGLRGAAQTSPTAAVLFVAVALSLIGIPPLPGFWAKYLLVSALLDSASSLHYLAAGLLLLTTVIEAAYLMRIATRLYAPADHPPQRHAPRDLASALALGGCLLLGAVAAAPLGTGLARIAADTVAAPAPAKGIVTAAIDVESLP